MKDNIRFIALCDLIVRVINLYYTSYFHYAVKKGTRCRKNNGKDSEFEYNFLIICRHLNLVKTSVEKFITIRKVVITDYEVKCSLSLLNVALMGTYLSTFNRLGDKIYATFVFPFNFTKSTSRCVNSLLRFIKLSTEVLLYSKEIVLRNFFVIEMKFMSSIALVRLFVQSLFYFSVKFAESN